MQIMLWTILFLFIISWLEGTVIHVWKGFRPVMLCILEKSYVHGRHLLDLPNCMYDT